MTCSNKVRQLTLAVHNYLTASNEMLPGISTFPLSGGGDPAAKAGRTATVTAYLLPYSEQNAIADKIKGDYRAPGTTGTGIDQTVTNGAYEPWQAQMDALACPSDGMVKNRQDGNHGQTSYSYSTGDWPGMCNNNDDQHKGENRGPFLNKMTMQLSGITDGTSNTIMISERSVDIRGRRTTRDSVAQQTPTVFTGGDDTTGNAVSNFVPNKVYELLDTSDTKLYKTGLTVDDKRTGQRWACAIAVFTTFSTILPPNSPSALRDGDITRFLGAPKSYHPGGVNVSMCDASGRFMTDSVGTENLDKGAVQSGKSPYGVWGALGSAAGAESKAP
jgi:hypothetical protein